MHRPVWIEYTLVGFLHVLYRFAPAQMTVENANASACIAWSDLCPPPQTLACASSARSTQESLQPGMGPSTPDRDDRSVAHPCFGAAFPLHSPDRIRIERGSGRHGLVSLPSANLTRIQVVVAVPPVDL